MFLDHIRIVRHQQKQKGWKGYIVTNANCSSTGLVVALKVTNNNIRHIIIYCYFTIILNYRSHVVLCTAVFHIVFLFS